MSRQFREIIISMMRRDGRDFELCELCGKPTDGKPDIHHTKYDGATYQDLKIVCRSCNNKHENKLLD